ncbi:MAG: hypothetical protein PHY94_00300 [Candidatus Omnitrophica bacterium]|nr:hypothetical protein [Candidatus Omnitrophota bacterium]
MKKNLPVIIIFVLLVVVVTFPLIFNISKAVPGFYSTDESFGALWDSWRIKFSFLHKLSFSHIPLVAYPFGIDMYQSGFIPYLWVGIIYFLSIATNPVLAFNLQVFFNLFFSAFLTYLLVFHLTKKRSSGIFSGIIFAFCPYQFARIWQHLGLSYNELIVFSLYAMILLRENTNRKNFLLFFFSLFLLLSFDFSIMFFGFLVLSAFIIYSFISGLMEKKPPSLAKNLGFIKYAIFAAGFAVFILSFQFFPLIKNIFNASSGRVVSAYNQYHRPFNDLFEQSARPLSYFLPAVVHPVFGKFTEQFLGSQVYGVSLTEHTLYLGWVPLVFAFFAFRGWRLKRKRATFERQEFTGDNFFIGFFIFLAVLAWFFSQPPWWQFGQFKIYMPGFFIYKILPMYRAYCRFGIVVMLAIAVLAGYGLKFFLEKFKSKKKKKTMAILFCSLVLFEFWNYPPFRVIDVSRSPAVYYWLRGQPKKTVIAEYPLDADSPSEMYRFYQTVHEKTMINYIIPGTLAQIQAQSIRKLSDIKTTEILKEIGVRAVLVHRDLYLDTGLAKDREELEKISENKGLKLMKSFPAEPASENSVISVEETGPIDVYEVIAN